jgi:hypothetical protein
MYNEMKNQIKYYAIFITPLVWKEILNNDGQKYHQHKHNEQTPLTSNNPTEKKTTYGVGYPSRCLRQTYEH